MKSTQIQNWDKSLTSIHGFLVSLSSLPFSFHYFTRNVCFLEEERGSTIVIVDFFPPFFSVYYLCGSDTHLSSLYCLAIASSIYLNCFDCLFTNCVAGWWCILSTHLLSSCFKNALPRLYVCNIRLLSHAMGVFLDPTLWLWGHLLLLRSGASWASRGQVTTVAFGALDTPRLVKDECFIIRSYAGRQQISDWYKMET